MRTERDSMGTMDVPDDALYGAQTRRAELNFEISGWTMPPEVIHTLGRLKAAAAVVNHELGLLTGERAAWIERAGREVSRGEHDDQFVVDVFQTGSGTSTHMNANEVIANRAIQLAGGRVGSKEPVHPNDHVNLGQSSNDVIPTAIQVAAAVAIDLELLPALARLAGSLTQRARAFDDVVTLGRTHLQDATPIRMGQVFDGYATGVDQARRRLARASTSLLELPLGGTAVGTGINTHPEFGGRVAALVSAQSGLAFREARDHASAQSTADVFVEVMGALKGVALGLAKVANDIRLLASGPRGGLGELILPAVQPGSSIMPGKVNPVIAESLLQVSGWVVGAEASITWAATMLSNFQLNTAQPLIAHQLLGSIRLLARATANFEQRTVRGLTADRARCADRVEQSLALGTALAPRIGYDAAAALVKQAHERGLAIGELARELQLLDPEELRDILDPRNMTGDPLEET
jgi:fumarate hydratase, class II